MTQRVKIGDIYEVPYKENGTKAYFQYLMKDYTQMNTNVIKVFKTHYKENEQIDLYEFSDAFVKGMSELIDKYSVDGYREIWHLYEYPQETIDKIRGALKLNF